MLSNTDTIAEEHDYGEYRISLTIGVNNGRGIEELEGAARGCCTSGTNQGGRHAMNGLTDRDSSSFIIDNGDCGALRWDLSRPNISEDSRSDHIGYECPYQMV